MAGRLDGKVAIVTGAGQTPGDTIGNGRAISLLFAREGARVLLVDKNLASAQETYLLITREGKDALAFEADVTRADDCRRMTEACLERFGKIDILVNNVGTGGEALGPVKLKEEDWDRIFAVNAKSVFLTSKYVIPRMEAQGGGVIINISSIAAVCATPMLAYRSSKAAVNALTQSLAIMYGPLGIRVNSIMPGLMDTPMAIEGISRARGISKEELRAERAQRVPLKGGMGTAWDTAYAALFLASDEAKFITGAILPVDGGQSARIG
ncbi:MAG: SDR family oxidoreductase [Syntrophales bacterium]|nr:SDR family oxidoreductase [Syntrophales bacterium]